MGKINTTNYPNRPVSAYQDDDMFILQDNGGETYTTNVGDIKDLIEDETDPKLALKVDKNGTDRLMTAAEGTKLAGIAAGAQVNVLEGVVVDSIEQPISGKKAFINLSGKTNLSVIADEFHDPVEGEPQFGYFKGTYVTYNGKLYEFTEEHTGAWNPSHVREIKAAGQYVRAGSGGYNLGDRATCEGYNVKASGNYSHAEGRETQAVGECTHAEGRGTVANSIYQHVEGKYNVADNESKYIHIIGNGIDANNRNNAFTIDWDGNMEVSGEVEDGNGEKISDKANDSAVVHKTGNEDIAGNKHFTGDVIVDGNIIGKKGTIYGFHIDNEEDDPDEKVSYLYDAVGMKPAHMDFTNSVFDFGTWEDAFFMPKPCMLKPDGTVDFYLDKNNFKKKADGVSDSHVNHLHIVEASATAALAHAVDDYFVYDGKLYQTTVAIEIGDTITPNTNCTEISGVNVGDNAMIEWGQNNQKIWYCIEPSANRKSATILISNYKVNDSYKAWSFINMQGDMVDHFYTPAYKGVLVNGVMRSLSGCDYNYYVNNKTRAEEVALAEANNPSTDKLWYTEVRADNQLINFLTILMFKSTDIQAKLGEGRTGFSWAQSNVATTGIMDDKGLFYGESSSTGLGCKLFGREQPYGDIWMAEAGTINASGVPKNKMTYGTQDGSTANGYNTDGTGYLADTATYPSASGTYITEMIFDPVVGMIPIKADTSNTNVDYCDGLWTNNSQTNYALRGGSLYLGRQCGAFCLTLDNAAGHRYWNIGAALSCKPLA